MVPWTSPQHDQEQPKVRRPYHTWLRIFSHHFSFVVLVVLFHPAYLNTIDADNGTAETNMGYFIRATTSAAIRAITAATSPVTATALSSSRQPHSPLSY